MTSYHDDTPFWDEPDWSGITETPRPRRTHGERSRTHHVVVRKTPLPPLERSGDADFWSEGWPDEDLADVDVWVEPLETVRPRAAGRNRGIGVDPRLLRLGALTAAVVLMVPIALALRDDGGGGDLRSTDVAAGAASTTTAAPSLLAGAGAVHQRRGREPRAAKQSTSTLAEVTAATAASADVDGDVMSVSLSASATREEPACAGKYTVVDGDYWVRFAESSGAELGAWLNANGATAETPLYAGDVLCVPAGATIPEPPPSTTDAPETTPAPTTTEAPETTPAPTTTDAPTTTEPPSTAVPTTEAPETTPAPPPDPVTPGSVEAIIRAVWPDELEDRAVVIAQRESSLQPDAYNGWCCYGLFQIYFDANRSFLASLGVTSAQQLLDARTNATVAYAMYQRSGWAPWATTDPG
jgi:Transglycosylase SLT domain